MGFMSWLKFRICGFVLSCLVALGVRGRVGALGPLPTS